MFQVDLRWHKYINDIKKAGQMIYMLKILKQYNADQDVHTLMILL